MNIEELRERILSIEKLLDSLVFSDKRVIKEIRKQYLFLIRDLIEDHKVDIIKFEELIEKYERGFE